MYRGAATTDLATWRDDARRLLAADVRPADIHWTDGTTGLLFSPSPSPSPSSSPSSSPSPGPRRVPRSFLALAEAVLLHRAAHRHDLLYRALWRLTHGEPDLLAIAVDPDVRALTALRQAVRRDLHTMHAFVRFRRVVTDGPGGEHFVAWYAPDHHILAAAAPFFRDRFAAMAWSILTPHASVGWDGADLVFGPGVPRHAAPAADELEALWRTYYASIFNPARANPRAMQAHMPRRFWAAMPETALVPELLAAAPPRTRTMIEGAAAVHLPVARDLAALRAAARTCTACDLCQAATTTVFGEGPPTARLLLVGEQPGDEEDRAGRPFVGPAGAVLDDALRAAGVARDQLYVTNAVKHFRFEPRGKKRIHKRPGTEHVRACRPWLDAEIAAIRPRAIVCLGVTAARSFFGADVRRGQTGGEIADTRWGAPVVITYHPAAVLRLDGDAAIAARHQLGADLVRAAALAEAGTAR
jgi:probable DNA metabolism protein